MRNLILVVSLTILQSMAAWAAELDESLRACQEKPRPDERLSCYDQLAKTALKKKRVFLGERSGQTPIFEV